MERTIKLELTIPETNALLNILVSRPYGEVANLFGKIQYQAQGQVPPQEAPTETPPPEVSHPIEQS